MKQCSTCKEIKSPDCFHRRKNRPSGLHSRCKECRKKLEKQGQYKDEFYMRRYDLRKSYGITLEEYNEIFLSQSGNCAICGRHNDEAVVGRKKYLCVDHDHDTGKVRGLLCDKCNRGLGMFCDNEELLEAAISYLNKYNEKHLIAT